MALSGSFYTNVGSHWRLQLEWSGTQSVSGNYTDVTAKLYWIALDSYGAIYSSATKDGGIYISGSWSYFSGAGLAALSANQKKLLHTYTKRINHNSDGTGSVTLDGFFDAEVTLSGTYYGRINLPSKTYTLNTIPRASSLTSSASWTAPNNLSISISRASTSFTHTVKIYAGSTLIKTLTGIRTSATASFTTSENTSIFNVINTGSSTSSKIELLTYSGSTYIGMKTYTGTISAPSASSVSSSTDRYRYVDENFPVSLSVGHSSFTHTLKWTFGSFTKTISGVGSSYTWDPTSTEEQSIYAQIPNAKYGSGTLQVTTYYNGEQVRTPTSVSIQWHVRNSEPTFGTGYTYKDTNTTTTGITGDATKIIQNKSSVLVEIPTTAKATARNSATMVEYVATLNGVSITQPYSDTATVSFNFGAVNANVDLSLTIKAVDSRGFSTSTSKTVTIIPYSNPTVTTSASRANNFENSTTVKMSGGFSPLTIGGVDKNTVSSVQYRYKTSTSTTWGAWTDFVFSISGSSYFATDVVLDLDNMQSWNIEVRAVDKLGSTVVARLVGTGQPIFFIDTTKKALGVNKFPTFNRDLEVGGTGAISAKGLFGQYMNDYMIYDHGNGNVTLNALGGDLYLGYRNSAKVRLSSDLYTYDGVKLIIDKYGNLKAASGTLSVSKNGTDSYIRFDAQTNDPAYIRHYESSNTGIMYFSASDDRTSGDYFSFGSTPGGTYSEAVRIQTDGHILADGNLYLRGSDAKVYMSTTSGSQSWYGQNGGNLAVGTDDIFEIIETDASASKFKFSANNGTFQINNGVVLSNQSGNTIRIQTAYGYTQIGPKNSSWAHFYTDRPSWYFDKEVAINNTLKGYGTYLNINTTTPSDSGSYLRVADYISGSYGTEVTLTSEGRTDLYGAIGTSGNRFYRMYSGAFSTSSSMHIKKNIKNARSRRYKMRSGIELSALEAVRSLTPYRYNFYNRPDKVEEEQIGILTEEAPIDILDEDLQNVDLYSLSMLLMQALQEADERLDFLERKLNMKKVSERGNKSYYGPEVEVDNPYKTWVGKGIPEDVRKKLNMKAGREKENFYVL
jgi:hypothetical protein